MTKSIKKILKKIMRRVKRVFNKHDEKIKVFKNKRILRIHEICKLLEIKVPNEYKEIKNKLVIYTPLFNKLENRKDIKANIISREDFPKEYYINLKDKTRAF